ncbi:MAG: hypothetical protein ACMUHM_05815 [Thermoplasmatota archaeon]
MGKMKLLLLAALGSVLLIMAIVNMITSAISSALGVNVGFEIGCLIFVVILIAAAIPWIIFASKFKNYRDIKKREEYELRKNCPECGKELVLNRFGRYCERCKKYD